MSRRRRAYSLFVIAVMIVAGCSRATDSKSSTGKDAKTAHIPRVTVATATTETIVDDREFTGRTAAVATVEIRPRVSGYLLQTPRAVDHHTDGPSGSKPSLAEQGPPDKSEYHQALTTKPPVDSEPDSKSKSAKPKIPFVVNVREGDFVAAGDPLFEIDPAPYRLAYLQATGSLDAADAQLKNYRRDLVRQNELLEKKAGSQSDFDAAAANVAETIGTIENLKATIDLAYLNWTYTQLRSPISGLVGVSQLTLGNLALADSTVLTTVGAIDPIYVYFQVDENSVLDYLSRMREGQVRSAREAKIQVQMSLADEKTFPHHGVVDFVDNTVDPSTGNYRLRARFDNSDRKLLPGLFAVVRVPFTAAHQAILIPTVALATDQQGQYVMVVNDQNHVHRRSVVEGTKRGDRSVIRDGLTAGEKVIVSGLQRVRDGVAVQITSDNITSDGKQHGSPTEPKN